MNWLTSLKAHLSRVLLFVFLMTLAVLLILYYFGVYDIAFIDRPASWNKTLSDFLAPFTHEKSPSVTTEPEGTQSPSTTEPSGSTEPDTTQDPYTPPVLSYQFRSVAELQKNGYSITNEPFDYETMRLGVLSLAQRPSSWFSLNNMVVRQMYYYFEDKNAEKYNVRSVGYRDVTVPQPSIQLYMGWIFLDIGNRRIQVLNNAGQAVLIFSTDDYKPAYTRDKNGRPLFYRNVTKTAVIPASSSGMLDREFTYEEKEYFYINESKKRFDPAEYVDETDGRGLYYDYPSYFGAGDSSTRREVKLTEHYTTLLSGEDTRTLETLWRYRGLTDYKFSKAYAYQQGRATAEYTYELSRTQSDGTEQSYSITAMQILNEKGNALFRPYKTLRYQTWYLYEWYILPDSYGEESIGFYYYDHGLIRVRRQRVDYSFFINDGILRIMEDADYLMDLEGNLLELPSGLTLKAYSDGILLVQDSNGRYGYYDYHLCCIADPVFSEAKAFSEGLGVACDQNGNWGVIDTHGNVVLPFEFTYISQVSSGLLACYRDGQWTVFQKMAK